ncbi:MAG: sugar ABC transporter permease [Anaerolineae bacterium]|nr:sugar ABC transporter permease [Anaerolineae bacterium]
MKPRLRISQTQQEEIEGYLWISPWLFGLLTLTLGPLVASFLLSFTQYDIVNKPIWVGLNNYRLIFKDQDFYQSLKVTFTWALMSLPLHLVLNLAFALLLNLKIRGMYFFRTLFYIPNVLPGVATVMLWMWLLNPSFGLINYLLSSIGIQGPMWFASPRWALPGLLVMSLWGVGGGAIIYLAGLQNIPPHLYEAAEIDGAGTWHRFWHITLPLLTPTIFFTLVMGMIGVFQVFLTAFVATAGGPLKATLFYMLYLYTTAFQSFKMGYASALAWILALIIFFFTILVFRSSSLWVHYEAERTRKRGEP